MPETGDRRFAVSVTPPPSGGRKTRAFTNPNKAKAYVIKMTQRKDVREVRLTTFQYSGERWVQQDSKIVVDRLKRSDPTRSPN